MTGAGASRPVSSDWLPRRGHRVLSALAVFALAGCTWNNAAPAYFINASDVSLKVSVSMPGRLKPAGSLSTCRLDPQRMPMTIGDVEQVRHERVLLWPPVALANYDPDRCTATIDVPPGKAVLMYWDGSCSDYQERRSISKVAPTIDRLSIAGRDRSILLTGFQTAMAFKSSARHRDCTYEIR
jgi:hypothetical protein